MAKNRRPKANLFSMRDALRDQRHVTSKPQKSSKELGLLDDIKRRGFIQIDPSTMNYSDYHREYEEYKAFASRHGVEFLDGGNWFAVGTPAALKNLAGD